MDHGFLFAIAGEGFYNVLPKPTPAKVILVLIATGILFA